MVETVVNFNKVIRAIAAEKGISGYKVAKKLQEIDVDLVAVPKKCFGRTCMILYVAESKVDYLKSLFTEEVVNELKSKRVRKAKVIFGGEQLAEEIKSRVYAETKKEFSKDEEAVRAAWKEMEETKEAVPEEAVPEETVPVKQASQLREEPLINTGVERADTTVKDVEAKGPVDEVVLKRPDEAEAAFNDMIEQLEAKDGGEPMEQEKPVFEKEETNRCFNNLIDRLTQLGY